MTPRKRRHTSGSPPQERPFIGIALGSGSARGWAHIGILRALLDLGIEPQIVTGSSMGALVGAAYAYGQLDGLEAWALALRRHRFLSFLDLRLPGSGLVRGDRLMEQLAPFIPDTDITELPLPFAAVATDLGSGREVWLREGNLVDAVRASIAIPGLLTPLLQGDRWLVDGGLVNPVPVSLCRAMGAQLVIGVNPFGDRLSRIQQLNALPSMAAPRPEQFPEEALGLEGNALGVEVKPGALRALFGRRPGGNGPKNPAMMDVLMGALNIMQDRITRSRMAGDPPDVLLAPRLSQISLLEFDRAEEAIAEGRACVERMLPVLQDAVGL